MHTIEAFAWLCAILDTSLLGRDGALAAAGLDEATWKTLCDASLPLLAAGDAPDVAARFAAAYATARQRRVGDLGQLALPELAEIRAALGFDADDTEESVAPLQVLDVDGTAELVLPPVGPVIPFRTATMLPPPGPGSSAPEPSVAADQPAADDPQELTLEVPHTPPPPRPALPFCAVPTAPRQRLVRFDTQTGAPLERPYWVDDVTR